MSLKGKIFINTQSENALSNINEYLLKEEAIVHNMPMIEVKTTELNKEHHNKIQNIFDYQWLIFTSKNGVQSFFELALNINPDFCIPVNCKVGVIGEKTGKALKAYSVTPYYISNSNNSIDFANELSQLIKKNEKILLIQGNLASNNIENTLKPICVIEKLIVYNTIPATNVDKNILNLIYNDNYDLLIFTSPSAFRFLYEMIQKDIKQLQIKAACIGETTAKELISCNIKPLIIANNSNIYGLYQSIKNYYI
jgi:uroporphyrinogen-III synthase